MQARLAYEARREYMKGLTDMAFRKLTIVQADELRRTREMTGASYATLGLIYGIPPSCVRKIVKRMTYTTPRQHFGPVTEPQPTPHSEITYDGWHRDMLPMPARDTITPQRHKAQNERDGYLRDPDYLAAVAAWRDEGASSIAAD